MITGFSFNNGTMIVTQVTSYGRAFGVDSNRKILRVNGIHIKDAKQYLQVAKSKQTFQLTLGPKVRQSIFSPRTTTPPKLTHTWQWLDNSGWKYFSKPNEVQIENAFQNGRSFKKTAT